MRNGFTLVELSIVLVIIGLLIGGILVGQSLIESAQTNKVISYFQQTEVATQQFKNKYKFLPGDYPRAAFGFPGGNGDGVIADNETYRGLHMLEASKMIDLRLNPTGIANKADAATWAADKVLPNFGVKGSIAIFGQSNSGRVNTRYNEGHVNGACKNPIRLGNNKDATGAIPPTNYPYPDFARWWFEMPKNLAPSIDKKVDDGQRVYGKVMGTGTGLGGTSCTSWVNGQAGTDGAFWAPSAGYYDVSMWTTNGYGCMIIWCLDE